MTFPAPFYKWRPHPWNGLEIGPAPPRVVHAFIEICPFDLVKYEVDNVRLPSGAENGCACEDSLATVSANKNATP